MNGNLPRISDIDAVEIARVVRPLTDINERECVAKLAADVPPGGSIVEIGSLYGGMTAVLGLANPEAKIVSIDDYSWHPADDVPTSKELLLANMKRVGVKNVKAREGDSRVIGKTWKKAIDLLWIDGGHSYEYVHSDLVNFGPHARVIAVHDYKNPAWATIEQAINDFIQDHPEWAIVDVVGMVAVLKRKGEGDQG
jgi:tRNA and rRNA cytosine-C5-methylases